MLGLTFLTVLAFEAVAARQLPIKTYTTEDGLPRNEILRVRADSRGLLWFCTPEGLARFDGTSFRNYSKADGLPGAKVNDLLATRDGAYWVATNDGLARFDPAATGRTRFTALKGTRLREFTALLEDNAGRVWLGAADGLFRVTQPFMSVEPEIGLAGRHVLSLAAAGDGSIFVGTRTGIFRRSPSGAIEAWGSSEGIAAKTVSALLFDGRGGLWAGAEDGLYEFVPAFGNHRLRRTYRQSDGLSDSRVRALNASSRGEIWAGGPNGVSILTPSETADAQVLPYGSRDGIKGEIVNSIAEDAFHNIWLGTRQGGAINVLRTGFYTYTGSAGLVNAPVLAFFADRLGRVHAVNGRDQLITRLDGPVATVQPAYRSAVNNLGLRRSQIALQDRTGDYWIATFGGLYRFPRVSDIEHLPQPSAVYAESDGLPTSKIFRIFEDSNGDIWIAGGVHGLSVWQRRTRSFRDFSGVPDCQRSFVSAFAEDSRGRVWMSMMGGWFVRYEAGRLVSLRPQGADPDQRILCFIFDRAGRLWFGTQNHGLGRVDDPEADRWTVKMYTTAERLSSNSIEALAEDDRGRIYAGTGRGLDRLDARSGEVRGFGPADGFPPGLVRAAFRDTRGRLWFGTTRGLSEFVPGESDAFPQPPLRTFISGILAGGRRLPVSELGEPKTGRFSVESSGNHVRFELLSTGAGEGVRYQYRLSESAEWTAPATDHIVDLVSLASGRYRFEAKALASDGRESAAPAIAEFVVLRPVWARWWFVALGAAALFLAAWRVQAWKVARAVELERVRTRIATDLHDDIGSSLSQIAIMSEVIRSGNGSAAGLKDALADIAATAREAVDSMSDIVWAVDPGHDDIRDLTHRMRRCAEDLCGARDIVLAFRAADSMKGEAGADIRRESYLVFKEALNNAVRHSSCTRIEIDLVVAAEELRFTIADNGGGFDVSASSAGHGLRNIRGRAGRVNGTAEWWSSPNGTTFEFRAPVRPSCEELTA